MTHHTNEKAPGATNTEGLETDTTNEQNFATGTRRSKAIAMQIAHLAIAGHVVHKLIDGSFLVCKYGMTRHCANFAELAAFAKKLGVKHE